MMPVMLPGRYMGLQADPANLDHSLKLTADELSDDVAAAIEGVFWTRTVAGHEYGVECSSSSLPQFRGNKSPWSRAWRNGPASIFLGSSPINSFCGNPIKGVSEVNVAKT
jgi:hypothetical protein